MQFAWQKKKNNIETQPSNGSQLVKFIYNMLWLLPIVLGFAGTIAYSTAFIAFTAVTVVRFCANLFVNNRLPVAHFDNFPFRA